MVIPHIIEKTMRGGREPLSSGLLEEMTSRNLFRLSPSLLEKKA
jgi:hypothetical protein